MADDVHRAGRIVEQRLERGRLVVSVNARSSGHGARLS
jgi:hypothetical protein